MTFNQNTRLAAMMLAGLIAVSAAQAQSVKKASAMKTGSGKAAKMVAYDAKDKRFYSVAWAKAHGMHDKGGDKLTIVPLSSLPKEAQESKAMHGAKM